MLKLGDFENGYTDKQVYAHVIEVFCLDSSALDGVKILVAYESKEDYSASNWFLLRKGQRLFENHVSHCSCYGFENQWKPEKTIKTYLKSDKFSFWGDQGALDKIKNWIKQNL